MIESVYTIHDDDDWFGCILRGPKDFECCLGEPEDRTWYRDGAPAVDRLNAQHDRIAELEAAVKELDARLGEEE